MATIEPQTAAHRTEAGIDYEKNIAYDNGAQEVNHDTKQESDAESENFQGGVQRVRAITSVWSKKTMIIMFCL